MMFSLLADMPTPHANECSSNLYLKNQFFESCEIKALGYVLVLLKFC